MISTIHQRNNMHAAIKYAEQICYSSKEVLHFTYEMARKYADKPGIYCEAGVAAGAQVIAMMAGARNKTVWALDSFKGIPLPSDEDDQMPGIRFLTKEEQKALPNPGEQLLESSGATVVSKEDFINHVHNAIGDELNLVIVGGWFEESLPNLDIPEIALLRLDGDLYHSTYVCLQYLYPKVINGGLVILDDYALEGCRMALFDYLGDDPHPDIKYIKDENSTVAYWTK